MTDTVDWSASDTANACLAVQVLAGHVHRVATEKGWWDEPRSFGDIIALIHSEASEALEEYRSGEQVNVMRYEGDGKPEGVPAELADIVIRILDACGFYGIDIATALYQKIRYNESRPYRHGGKKL